MLPTASRRNGKPEVTAQSATYCAIADSCPDCLGMLVMSEKCAQSSGGSSPANTARGVMWDPFRPQEAFAGRPYRVVRRRDQWSQVRGRCPEGHSMCLREVSVK